MIEGPTPIRLGIWCAVSSQAQAKEEKISLTDQEAQGRRFAQALGAEVIRVYTVPGHSRDLVFWQEAEATMIAYKELRQDIEAGRLDVLHVLDPDRLGRDPALAQQVISLVEKAGAEVYFASSPHQIGQKTIAHRYITAIQSVRASEDQALRLHRYKMGMRHRVARGLHPNRWPYGYKPIRDPAGSVVGAELDPEEAAAIRYMVDLFLEGRSYYEIMARLKESHHRPPEGGIWHYSAIRRILLEDLYAGFVSWGEVKADRPSDRFPALWPPDLHRAILKERARRGWTYSHPRGGPLSGVAYCLRCGHTLGRMASKGVRYLRCNLHSRKHEIGRSCHPNYIQEAQAVAQVAGWLAGLADPQALEAAIGHPQGPGTAELTAQAEAQARRVAGLEGQRTRLALAYASSTMDPVVYRQADLELLGRLEAAQARAADLMAALEAVPDRAARVAALEAAIATLPELVATAEPAQVAHTLQGLGCRAYFEEGSLIFVGLVEV